MSKIWIGIQTFSCLLFTFGTLALVLQENAPKFLTLPLFIVALLTTVFSARSLK